MPLHAYVPDSALNVGSLIETVLPWLGLAVPVTLGIAAVRRSRRAAVGALLPAVVWLLMFGGTAFGGVLGGRATGGDLTVVSHNVNEDNPDPGATAAALSASHADLVALEELSPEATPAYEKALAGGYPYHAVEGTVGLWSRYPLSGTRELPIMPWPRALRSTVAIPRGPVAVFVAHLASVRVSSAGFTVRARDEATGILGAALRADPLPRTILMGDLNGTVHDRALAPVTRLLHSAQDTRGAGFGFTWPAAFPLARIDNILVRGVTPVSSWTLPATPSDHLPVAARIDL
ncbi:endonuclease/exonuclease/phosphatase family protein [Streptomyces sp. TS71-3]|uniref:endonuclease/exonuclease/phosphatase family protein n=1 Tax=Streptomyces sp. TS71-3 TaxID=2733862 RepID=UPI001BB2F947|nr:endonuclease/exonuclease/phosphatase family protein [Streptomyces sp. TS71-3]